MGNLIQGLFSSMISLSIPLLIAAEGEIFVERSGQFNMGIEGIMAISALTAFSVALASGSVFLGLLAGTAVGIFSGIIIYLLIQKIKLGGIVVAIVFNLLASGITGFLAALFINSNSVPMQSAKLEEIAIPFLSDIPFIGPVLFSQNMMVYLAILCVPIANHVLFHSRFGLELRAVGEKTLAAETMGINTFKTKMHCFAVGGASAGLAGAYMSLTLGMFVDSMTASKGFIAMALCAFSGMSPYGTLFGALFFALADSLQLRLQVFKLNIPYEFFLMLPYVLTVVVLVIVAIRSRHPLRPKTDTEAW